MMFKKTDSLVSPLVGQIEATKETGNEQRFLYKIDLAFQDDKWVITKLHETAWTYTPTIGWWLMWKKEEANFISVELALKLKTY